jgi:hypothetical protein
MSDDVRVAEHTFVCHVAGSTFLCQGIQSKVKFRNYDCHYKLIDPIEIPVSELIKDILPMDFCSMSN